MFQAGFCCCCKQRKSGVFLDFRAVSGCFFRDEKQDLALNSLGMPLELCREESRG